MHTNTPKKGRLAQLLSLLAITTGFIVGCGGGGTSGVSVTSLPSADCADGTHILQAPAANSSNNAALAAATVLPVAGKKTISAVPAGTLRIHYKRTAGDYTGWGLYTYSPEVMGGWPGALYNAAGLTGSDSFGPYWDVPVAAATTINFIINLNGGATREPSNWSGHNSDEQQFWTMADGNEIWKLQGDATNYTSNPSGALPDVTKVRVHYKRFDGNYTNFGLHMWSGIPADGSGLDDAALATAGVSFPGWSNATNFADMPGYTTDSFGIVFEIPVKNPSLDTAQTDFQFIIHGDGGAGGSDGDKDGWTDNIRPKYLAMTVANQTADIWLVQETASVYYSVPDLRSASTSDAKAYWLTKDLIKWPRVGTDGVHKLYYASAGGIAAPLDGAVSGADGSITLSAFGGSVPTDAAERFKYVSAGVVLQVGGGDLAALPDLHKKQVVLVQEIGGTVQNVTTLQIAGALDDLYSGAATANDLGLTWSAGVPTFKLWAPTANTVKLNVYDTGSSVTSTTVDMTLDAATGIWSYTGDAGMKNKYYTYTLNLYVKSTGAVTNNEVTDPYSVSLNANSTKTWLGDLTDAATKPTDWETHVRPASLPAQEDMVTYELHIRDFSITDCSVPADHRGKYLAFTDKTSNGMTHLKALADNGMTDIHLLPAFDLATVNESSLSNPSITQGQPETTAPRTAIGAVRDLDGYNWGYDPYHYTSPEGSYASDANDGAVRVKEFRAMVQAMHEIGLRVGMDVVYNHTTAAGQNAKSVLDRIVPGYYHRLTTSGAAITDTCCQDTAAENKMMEKLMIDSAKVWATQYGIDSFRFDLMAFHPRSTMEKLKTEVDAATGRDDFHILGEGWNYGSVANGARFTQASQLSLNGSGIGTFSDRGRDAVRGGNYQTSSDQGWASGYFYDTATGQTGQNNDGLLYRADMVRVMLAGSIRSFSFEDKDSTVGTPTTKTLEQILYGSDPAGYVTDPQEVVNYVENHDNQTLFDAFARKMPASTTPAQRARAQIVALSTVALSEGIAYFHAGSDILRSKSMDSNSYNSGDWFNRLDWTYTHNNFGVGLPFDGDDTVNKAVMNGNYANVMPAAADIAFARDAFKDLLAIRKSTPLFRMRTAQGIKNRLKFYNTGANQDGTVVVGHLDGTAWVDANFNDVLYLINADKVAKEITIDAEKAKNYELHPVHVAGADSVVKTATYDSTTGKFSVPARTTVVFVVKP